jgi:zinc/manganese transport system permease protein
VHDLSIIAPALAAALLVLASHVPLGREVLQRGIIFIDLALAQFAGLGLILAGTLGSHLHGWDVQLIAFASALAGAGLLALTEKWLGRYQEAAIGILFILAATASILLLAHNPHGGERLKDLLVGQILWVEWSQLWSVGVIAITVLGLAFGAASLFKTRWFYLLLAIAITASVQLVGVYLVFASLIIPSLATIKLNYFNGILSALVLGGAGCLVGLMSSLYWDLPSGAMMVWGMAVLGIFYAVIFTTRNKVE